MSPPLVLDVRSIVARIESLIAGSYANNSRLYDAIEHTLALPVIVHYLRTCAGLPAFDAYLRAWIDRVPAPIRQPYLDHLRLEETEDHAGLARAMARHLDALAPATPPPPPELAAQLRYPFAAERAATESVGYFLGTFLSTEILSAKRSRQTYLGLRRLGVELAPLRFLQIHMLADAHHSAEVAAEMVVPALAAAPDLLADFVKGVDDRLARTTAHLRWFETTHLERAHA